MKTPRQCFASEEELAMMELYRRESTFCRFWEEAKKRPNSAYLNCCRADCLVIGYRTPKNRALARRLLERFYPLVVKAAKRGDAVAQDCLGMLLSSPHLDGMVVKFDYAEGVRWFRLSASKGHAPAQCHLGLAYANGLGVRKNYKKSIKLFELSAGQGFIYAAVELGLAYYFGIGVEKDYMRAFSMLSHSEDAFGCELGRYILGKMFINGKGCSQSYERALAIFRRGAARGYPPALLEMGRLYFQGVAVPRNDEQGFVFFRHAAKRGYRLAQYKLSELYAMGRGCTKNLQRASYWAKRAIKNGYKPKSPRKP